jgi:glucosamine kinase
MNILIADSGSTKCEWCLLQGTKKKLIETQGISPYFLDGEGILQILSKELIPKISSVNVDHIFYYGTGCTGEINKKIVLKAIRQVFSKATIFVDSDLMGAARSLCGDAKGLAAILGTGSNSCYFNGKKILKNSPGLGYVLGDEGSGAYLGKRVLQYYLYELFDKGLKDKFDAKYGVTVLEILDHVYKKPLPNRYLASFAGFLVENRGHFMVEKIITEGIDDFFKSHLSNYKENKKMPIHFVGSIAQGFRDVLLVLGDKYGYKIGRILKKPMDGLIQYHK